MKIPRHTPHAQDPCNGKGNSGTTVCDFHTPLLIIEVEGDKPTFDYNYHAAKGMYAICSGLAFNPLGVIIYVFHARFEIVTAKRDPVQGVIVYEMELVRMQCGEELLFTQLKYFTKKLYKFLYSK